MKVNSVSGGRRVGLRVAFVVGFLLLVVLSLVVLYAITSRDASEPTIGVTETPTATAAPTATASPDPAPGEPNLVIDQYSGMPEGAEFGDFGAIVMVADGTIHVFTTGSSSCPELPVDVAVDGDAIVVTVESDLTAICTADFVPTTAVIAIPEDYQGAEPPAVRVERAQR